MTDMENDVYFTSYFLLNVLWQILHIFWGCQNKPNAVFFGGNELRKLRSFGDDAFFCFGLVFVIIIIMG